MLAAMFAEASPATESAEALFKSCQGKQTIAAQRECYPAVVKQSEAELVVVERNVRNAMVELENESAGSRPMRPVRAFDKAERAYRAFRAAESDRVSASYGSGNGGGLASYQLMIEMNLARIKQLKGQ